MEAETLLFLELSLTIIGMTVLVLLLVSLIVILCNTLKLALHGEDLPEQLHRGASNTLHAFMSFLVIVGMLLLTNFFVISQEATVIGILVWSSIKRVADYWLRLFVQKYLSFLENKIFSKSVLRD